MVSIKHRFQSTLPDGPNASLIKPSNWNEEHDITGLCPSVASRTELKALNRDLGVAFLAEAGREGFFVWKTGDYSVSIAADVFEGLHIKADAVPAAEGAWLRVFTGPVQVSWFGANGTASDDTAAIQAAMTVAGAGMALALKNGAVHTVSAVLIPLAGQKLFGNGGTLKKRAQIVTTTTTAITANSTTSVTLTSASGFAIGMQVAFAQEGVERKNLVYGTTLSAARKITNIVGNTLTLNAAPDVNVSVGGTCFLTFVTLSLNNSDCIAVDVTFDGNYSNWTYSNWAVTVEGTTGSLSENCHYHRCKFVNFPGEGLILYGDDCSVSGSHFENGNGNGVHFSGGTDIRVISNAFKSLNKDTDVGHPDGAIAWSLGHSHVTIADNYIEDCMAGVGGLDNTTSSHAIIANNTIRNCAWYGIMLGSSINHISILENHIYACGPTSGGTVTSPSGSTAGPDRGGIFAENVTGSDNVIAGNKVEDCSVYLSYNSAARRCSFRDNVVDGTLFVAMYDALVTGNTVRGKVTIGGSARSKFNGNYIDLSGDTSTIACALGSTAAYADVDICNNTIIGGAYGIGINGSPTALDGVSINNNDLYDQSTRAISVDNTAATSAGLNVRANVIRTGPNAGTAFNGIVAKPASITISSNEIVDTTGTANSKTAINYQAAASAGAGGVIKDNIIRGAWSNAIAMVASAGAWAINNIVDSGNVGSATGNNVSGTVTI